jgi:nitroreductase
MNEIIRKRKSIRKFEQTALPEAELAKVREQIADVTPLYPDIRYSIEIVSKTKGIFGIAAPHYLVFGSEEKDGYFENVGFIGQQMDLFFSESGIGSCWLGMAKPEEKGAEPHVICMAFGKPAEPLYRSVSGFKRKPLCEISEGNDARLEAARLAPSGINAQNWYFIAEDGKIHCYRKKLKFGLATARLGSIDMGIALCHIAKESEKFNLIKFPDASVRKGCIYMGTVSE